MLKTIKSSNKLTPSKNNGSRSAFSKNNNNKLVSEKNDGNGEINKFDVGENNIEYAKKLGKLSKSRKSKSEKTF